MKYAVFHIVLLSSLLSFSCKNSINDPVDELSSITKLDVYITDDNYSLLLENKFGDISVPADIYNGDSYIEGSVEAQGTGSRFFTKWGYRIKCKDNKNVKGLDLFNLSVQTYDKTKIKTMLTSYLYASVGLPLFYSSHAFLKINDEPKGLYVLTETITNDFFNKRNIPVYELIKVEYGAKFTYTETNILEDNFDKRIPDDENFSNLAEFIYAIDTTRAENILTRLSNFLDINEYLRYHAVTSIINNSDGFTNNFFLYKESPSSPYKIVPWDFDKTFNINENMGLWGESSIINKLFRNDSCYKSYISILKNELNNHFTEEKLFPKIDSVYGKIKEAYELDPFLNSSSLEAEINSLKEYIRERRVYLLSKLQ